jgi:hypothetical protein
LADATGCKPLAHLPAFDLQKMELLLAMLDPQ